MQLDEHGPCRVAVNRGRCSRNMERIDLISRLKNLLVQNAGLSAASLLDEQLPLFGANGAVDSVAILRLVVALEKEFALVVTDEDVQPGNFGSLAALGDFVERKLA